jgi:DUF4097 and DUF4098 domain-containing protein YvlB
MSTGSGAHPVPRALILLTLLSGWLLACAGSTTDVPTESRRQSFTVGPAPALAINLQSGALRVEAGPEGTITLDATLRDASRVQYELEQTGDTVSLRSTVSGASLTDVLSFRVNRGIDLKVTAPPATTIQFETLTGSVELRGLASSGTLKTGNGDINLVEVEGKFTATTGGGDISVSRHDGSLEVETRSGDLDILESSGTFQAKTGYGRMAFRGTVAPGGANHLESGEGRVFVTLQAAKDLTVEASGDSVDLNAPPSFKTTTKQNNRVSGTIGSGATTVTIRSARGSLDLQITE